MDFLISGSRELQPQLHEPEELTFRLENALKDMSYDTKAWARVKLRQMQYNYLPRVDVEAPRGLEYLLQLYMKIFDEVLFSGNLLRNSRGRYSVSLNVHFLGEHRLGCTSSKVTDDGVVVIITITPIVFPFQASYKAKEIAFARRLCILLHEMLHAYFHTFCNIKAFREIDRLGITGHGSCWQYAGLAIEQFVSEELGMNLFLSRLSGWLWELHKQRPEDVPRFKQQYNLEYVRERCTSTEEEEIGSEGCSHCPCLGGRRGIGDWPGTSTPRISSSFVTQIGGQIGASLPPDVGHEVAIRGTSVRRIIDVRGYGTASSAKPTPNQERTLEHHFDSMRGHL
ncbi:hypothetical protein V8E51_017055 [Hyaloscypha variabilis]